MTSTQQKLFHCANLYSMFIETILPKIKMTKLLFWLNLEPEIEKSYSLSNNEITFKIFNR